MKRHITKMSFYVLVGLILSLGVSLAYHYPFCEADDDAPVSNLQVFTVPRDRDFDPKTETTAEENCMAIVITAFWNDPQEPNGYEPPDLPSWTDKLLIPPGTPIEGDENGPAQYFSV